MIQSLFLFLSAFLIIRGYIRIARSHAFKEPEVSRFSYASLFFLACFSALALGVSFAGRASDIDSRIFIYFSSLNDIGMLQFMRSLSGLFDPLNFFALVLFCEAALLVRGHRKEAAFSSIVFLLAFFLSWSGKMFVESARPLSEAAIALGYSFPSGHTTLATAFFFTAYVFARPHIKNKEQQIGLILLALLASLLIGTSRLYLGVHWFSDVVGGLLLGLFSVFFVLAEFSVLTKKRKR